MAKMLSDSITRQHLSYWQCNAVTENDVIDNRLDEYAYITCKYRPRRRASTRAVWKGLKTQDIKTISIGLLYRGKTQDYLLTSLPT